MFMKSHFSRDGQFFRGQCFAVFSLIGCNFMRSISVKMRFLVLMFFGVLYSAGASTAWYVDSSVSSSGNGTSWTNAWKNLSNISGVSAGDVVYISGGPSGSTRTYKTPTSAWQPVGGTASTPIAYQIGQDADHNGIAIFDGNFSSQTTWLYVNSSMPGITISGNAGDGRQHFWVTNWVSLGSCSGATCLTLSYINFGYSAGALDFNPADGVQIDHCYAFLGNTSSDHFSYLNGNNSSSDPWGRNKAFCNVIYIPHVSGASGGGLGADCFQWNSTSIDIYSNLVVGYVTNYVGNQHQDGIQPLGGIYWRMHDNVFMDIANYPLFGDGYYTSFNYCEIYNNIVCFSDASIEGTAAPQAGGLGLDGGYIGNMPVAMTNCIVCNNLAVDYMGHTTWAFNIPSSFTNGMVLKNCWIANNISVNGGTLGPIAKGIQSVGNVVNVTASQASNIFVRYVPFGGTNNDFHLTTNAAALIGQGTNLFQFFAADKDGNARPSTSGWDVGPYQYTSGLVTAYPPDVSAICVNIPDAGTDAAKFQVYEGTTVQLSALVTSVTNGDALTWQWLCSLNGGTPIVNHSGSGAAPTNSFTYVIGTAGNTYVWTLQVTDSQTKLSAQSQLTMCVILEPPQGFQIVSSN